MCKKQTSVSQSSTESEIISLDAGLRMDGVLALDLCDVVIEVLHSSNDVPPTQKISTSKSRPKGAAGNCVRDNVAVHFEDNEAVIKVVIKIKGRRSMMRHVSRTHRVAFGGLFDRIKLDPKIQIKYFDTRSQLADLLTTGSVTRDE